MLEDSRFPEVAEPVGPLPLPPLPPALPPPPPRVPVRVPVRAGQRVRAPRPAEEPVRNPFRVPGLSQVLAARRANGAQRAIAKGMQMVRGLGQLPGPRGSEERTAASAERLAAAAAGPMEKARLGSKGGISRKAIAGATAIGAGTAAAGLHLSRGGGTGGFGGMFKNMSQQFARGAPLRKVSQNISGQRRRSGL